MLSWRKLHSHTGYARMKDQNLYFLEKGAMLIENITDHLKTLNESRTPNK